MSMFIHFSFNWISKVQQILKLPTENLVKHEGQLKPTTKYNIMSIESSPLLRVLKTDIEILDILYLFVQFVQGHFVKYILCCSETSARKAWVNLYSSKKDYGNWLNKKSWNTVCFPIYRNRLPLMPKPDDGCKSSSGTPWGFGQNSSGYY